MATRSIHAFPQVHETPTLAKGQADPQFASVQRFLARFGYLPSAGAGGPAAVSGLLDDATSQALAVYQRRHALPVTGVFDAATRAQMSKHRCGMPDLINGIEFVTRCSWPTPQLTFAFEDGTADTGGEFGAVRAAFASWAGAVPVLFTEVGRTQSPDVAIDWRPANDPDHSMIGGILAHSDFPPGCGVISDALPKPVHFDDSEHAWSVGAVPGAFDIETVALHELGHILGLQHSDVPGSVMFPTVDDNTTNRVLTSDDLAGIRSLYPTAVLANGTYTVRQKSSGRFLDAHEIEEKDFALVTRPVQDNDTQRWTLTQVGTVFVIRQKNSGRFLDAHESSDDDFRIVTRTAESNASQKWVAMPDVAGSVTLRQLSNRRFMDAHEIQEKDFALVTRPAQGNDTQRWTLTPAGANTFTIRQRSNGRFMDAHEIASKDFLVVTRPAQNNDTQRWVMSPVGAVYTIVQKSSQRFVDAHEISGKDFGVVSRPNQANDTQRWVLLPAKDGSFTVQQLSGGRFVDAHDSASDDFRVVTRGAENNDTQRWFFDRV
jgi:protease II